VIEIGMDEAEEDDSEENRRRSADDQGERLKRRPNSDEFATLNCRVEQDPVGIDTEPKEPEREQHCDIHRHTARDSCQKCPKVGCLHIAPRRTLSYIEKILYNTVYSRFLQNCCRTLRKHSWRLQKEIYTFWPLLSNLAYRKKSP